MTSTTERQQFAEQNEMSMDFVNWFFDKKKEVCGNAWFIMAAAMWEGWKGQAANREAQPVAVPEYLTYLRDPIISNVLADDDNSPMANAARILAREVKFWRSQPLFTAPPTSVAPEAD
ncbi:hypothetical protein AB3M75_16760 [Serratia ureilytica]|uniref:hypothetical protein n=1 Tax=Serratia ureilytica TaxID=300181 RepID=UPI0037123058